jgi:hypothetical protein
VTNCPTWHNFRSSSYARSDARYWQATRLLPNDKIRGITVWVGGDDLGVNAKPRYRTEWLVQRDHD